MTNVVIVGTDMIKFGRFPDRSVESLGAASALMALDDCGLTIHDMDAMYCGNLMYAPNMIGQRVMKEIGQIGIPVVNVTNACATGAAAIREAWLGIKAGVYETVLCVGVEKMPQGLLDPGGENDGIQREGIMGSGLMPCVFAEAGMEHSLKYGTTLEQFAAISVKNHHHSTMNPKAMYQIETPLEQVMEAEMTAYPNTKLMCSVNVDGSASAVLMSEDKARDMGLLSRAVRIKASALTSDPYSKRNHALSDWNSVTRLCAKQAYEQAGCSSEDIDLIELHDCFAIAEMLHYENLGLCEDGQAGRLVNEGETTLGGRIPVNVSGGLLSKGHPIGATGIANVYEIVSHLRDEAGVRQVNNARLGLTHVVGAGVACAIHVLERIE